MPKTGRVAWAAVLAMAVGQCVGMAAAQNGKASLSEMDSKFVKEAAQGGAAEVELGHLAMQKAASDDVKQFGQRKQFATETLPTWQEHLQQAEKIAPGQSKMLMQNH